MSELEVQKYVPELDHYLAGVDYHLYLDNDIDEYLLAHSNGGIEEFLDQEKRIITDAIAYFIKEKKLDDCITEEVIRDDGRPIRRLRTNVWVFSRKELEQFKEEVRAEALSGK